MANELFSSDPDGTTSTGEVDVETVKGKFVKEDGSLDVDALLVKAAHADKHISKIESENANLRSEVDKRINYQDLLDKITSTRQAASNPDNTNPDERAEPQVGITEQDIEKKIDARFNQKQQEALRAANEVLVVKELVKMWGPNYVSKLKARVQELEMTEDEAIQLSRVKPKAFLALVSPTVGTSVDTSTYSPPRTQQTTPMSGGASRNYAYYRDQMKKNPKLEHDHKFIADMHNQAAKQGEAFYN